MKAQQFFKDSLIRSEFWADLYAWFGDRTLEQAVTECPSTAWMGLMEKQIDPMQTVASRRFADPEYLFAFRQWIQATHTIGSRLHQGIEAVAVMSGDEDSFVSAMNDYHEAHMADWEERAAYMNFTKPRLIALIKQHGY